eukprot:CAMPEP_0204624940 /NCGR_PEP_ID=MMETSP0717-20131115/10700_1 /ASSEMBLY_ACC=CAM_ASM_000666 /TAXON_ID=230516 /ORGANISM="Chaetoceros curvisetus" /LENGTH=162 /DNA_ID=CAMNT_0051640501 /DNA_START=64 /DNA_END=549 /DNA_ORIENTATION=+
MDHELCMSNSIMQDPASKSRDDSDEYEWRSVWMARKQHSHLDQFSRFLLSWGKKGQSEKKKVSHTSRLEQIVQENIEMEKEVRRMGAKRDEYKAKMKIMEQVIAEISKTVLLMMKKNGQARRKLWAMERSTTRTSRRYFPNMLNLHGNVSNMDERKSLQIGS